MGEGTRSGLWSEIVRLIGDLRPLYVIVETVAALLAGPSERRGGWFGRVLGDLAECGYDAEWENIPASALGAPHRRERVWLVAYADKARREAQWTRKKRPGPSQQVVLSSGSDQNTDAHEIYAQGQQPSVIDEARWAGPVQRPLGPLLAGVGRQWVTEPDVGRVANGVPERAHRLAALGNAVVPQIPEMIGRAILQSEGRA
jgi:DNA (cytosine-5)-methyltransferase 1